MSTQKKMYSYVAFGVIAMTSWAWAQGLSFSATVKKVSPAIVSIKVDRALQNDLGEAFAQDPLLQYFFQDERIDEAPTIRAMGSGVIVSADGYVLTNYHVIKDTKELTIKLEDGRTFSGVVVACDPPSDLGVVQIQNGSKLPVAALGDSDRLEVGDVVLAIGNPFGVGQTVTQGIVSALQRKNMGLNLYEAYIQTDAAINPGNSGGGLVNLDGQLIGINTAILSRSGGSNGIGLAIPVNYAKKIMADLIKTGEVERGWVGIVMADFSADIREEFNYQGSGVLVRTVYAKSPAATAGIIPGDIILKVNGKKVSDSTDVRHLITELKENERAQLTILRNNKELNVTIVVARREPSL